MKKIFHRSINSKNKTLFIEYDGAHENIEKKDNKMLKKFDVMVYDRDLQDDGTIHFKPKGMQTVTGNSAQELIRLFAMCDQKIEILKEYSDQNQVSSSSSSGSIKSNEQNSKTTPPPIKYECSSLHKDELTNDHDSCNDKQPTETSIKQNVEYVSQKRVLINQKPKIITVGDIQLKYDGDKVYQKQWVKLNNIEALNLRVVNDSNNKIVSMNGKHIEAKKWVLVEDSNIADDVESNLELLNG